MLLISLAGPALAQDPADWVFPAGTLLGPRGGALAIASAGHPSVVYDSDRNRYIMVFEEQTQLTDARCPQGVWRLRVALSTDGLNWTPQAVSPFYGGTGPDVAHPDPGGGTYYSCVAANPTAVYRAGTLPGLPRPGLLTIFFKAEQDTDACAVSAPSWGCDAYTGFGRQTFRFNNAGALIPVTIAPATDDITTTPVFTPAAGETYGQPHAIRQTGTWRLAVQGYPDILEATGADSSALALEPDPLLAFADYRNPVLPWVTNELYNPSYLCDDDPAGDQDFAMFVGGRNTNAGVVISGAWSKATSDKNTISWALSDIAQVAFNGDRRWRHWEVTAQTDATTGREYVIYYSQKNSAGRNVIRLGGTDLTWSNGDFVSRDCP